MSTPAGPENLLPCPFCGTEPRYIGPDDHDPCAAIHCPNPRCCVVETYAYDPAEALARWNRRSPAGPERRP